MGLGLTPTPHPYPYPYPYKALGEEALHRVATSVGMKPGHAGR